MFAFSWRLNGWGFALTLPEETQTHNQVLEHFFHWNYAVSDFFDFAFIFIFFLLDTFFTRNSDSFIRRACVGLFLILECISFSYAKCANCHKFYGPNQKTKWKNGKQKACAFWGRISVWAMKFRIQFIFLLFEFLLLLLCEINEKFVYVNVVKTFRCWIDFG